MKRFLLIWVVIIINLGGCRSRAFDYTKLTDKVRSTTSEANISAELSAKSQNKFKSDRFYSWFDKGRIGVTQGNYSGKLINGNYTEWYLESKQLKAKGMYKTGLKTGKWMFWDEEGKLKEVQNWRMGRLIPLKVKQSMKSRLLKLSPFKRKSKS